MDATANPVTAGKVGLRSYPTLKFYRGGEPTDYTGARTEADIVKWVRAKSGPIARPLGSVEELSAFRAAEEMCVVGVFASESSVEAKVCMCMSVRECVCGAQWDHVLHVWVCAGVPAVCTGQ
jgi:protein disulfide-isomerase A1